MDRQVRHVMWYCMALFSMLLSRSCLLWCPQLADGSAFSLPEQMSIVPIVEDIIDIILVVSCIILQPAPLYDAIDSSVVYNADL